MKRPFFAWLAFIVGLEVLSRLVIFHPTLNSAVALVIGIGVLVLTVWRPTDALAVLAIEYLIGSKGDLLKFGGDIHNDGGISLRIILFVAFLVGWLIWSLWHKTWREWPSLIKQRKVYLVLAAVLIYAVGLGWLRGNREYLFVDANAWGAWLLLIPVLDVAKQSRGRFWPSLLPALLAALMWLPFKTLALDFLFSHQLATVTSPTYLWIRRTGVGEITKITDNAYRIFFQSHIYAVFAVLFGISAWAIARKKEKWILGLVTFSLVEIIVSLSRSFWIGLAAGLILIFVFTMKSRIRMVASVAGTAVLALLLVWLVMAFPVPKTDPFAFFKIFSARADVSESAVLSRWQLLPVLWNKIKEHPILGSGFGATVTYQSFDPRVVSTTGGQYTTYAFEWGWLDHWIKFGIVGIPLMLFLLWSIGRRVWKSNQPVWIRVSAIASIISLGAIHIFTPYLNHPLGIFALILAESLTV